MTLIIARNLKLKITFPKENVIMNNSRIYKKICLFLSILGAFNWGLVGILDFNLVTYVLGAGYILSRIVYILIGLSALFFTLSYFCKNNN